MAYFLSGAPTSRKGERDAAPPNVLRDALTRHLTDLDRAAPTAQAARVRDAEPTYAGSAQCVGYRLALMTSVTLTVRVTPAAVPVTVRR
jgi:hypothetical protein